VRVPRIVPFFVLSIPPRARRPLAVALLAVTALAAAYLLWLRDSTLVAVERVQVSGLTSRDAPEVRRALEAAAREMTTLHVSRSRLYDAVAGFPVVADLRVASDFPHGLRIEVVERRPVALVGSGADRVPVAADGSVLRGLSGVPRLPEVEGGGPPGGDRLPAGRARDAVAVLGAAPAALLERLGGVARDARGWVIETRGPEIVLGSADRLRAKWAAAAAVLADDQARGAAYVDVRMPERPVAGGLSTAAPEPEPAEEPQASQSPPSAAPTGPPGAPSPQYQP
jgi:cell division protein FtsQ